MKTLNDQSTNRVTISGKLVSVNLREGTTKTGKPYIGGRATVRVNQSYLGIDETSHVPVSFFATKYTSTGKNNPSYETIKNLETFNRIERDGETAADKVRLTGGSIRENAYASKNGTIVDGWQIDASFINKGVATADDSATFKIDSMVILNKTPEINRATGDETGRLLIKAGIVQYGQNLDILEFVVDDPNAAMQVDNAWDINSTVSAWGRIRVTVKEDKKPVAASSWGEDAPTEITTRTIRELVLTGGNPIEDEDFVYDIAEIKKGFNQHKAKHEEMLADTSTKAPAKKQQSSYGWE